MRTLRLLKLARGNFQKFYQLTNNTRVVRTRTMIPNKSPKTLMVKEKLSDIEIAILWEDMVFVSLKAREVIIIWKEKTAFGQN